MSSITPTTTYGLVSLLAQTQGAETQDKAASARKAYAPTEGADASSNRSVSVTLSEEAKAAVAPPTDPRPLTTIVAGARRELDTMLKAAKASSALKEGKPTIDVSGLDRRTLWAIATNAEGKFTMEERVVATSSMNDARDKSLATATSAMRVTGDYASLYRKYLASLDAAGPEEKAAGQWSRDRAAVLKGLDAAIAIPGTAPNVDGDPVAAYLKTVGGVVANPRTRDISRIASDVRTVLDNQYAASAAKGGSDGTDRGHIDFSKFDARSLAAVALNSGGLFSSHEAALASAEVKDRNWDQVSSQYREASSSADPATFGKSILTSYTAMSDEERQAAGWTPAFYDRMLEIQNMSDRIAEMFKDAQGLTLLDYL